MSVADKVVIVTGGSRGIGAGIAKRFAKEGAKVVITSRGIEQLQKTADEISAAGGTVLAIQEDAGKPVFKGNGENDYVCVECGNLLAAGMDPVYMTKKVRVRCGRCDTVNVAVTD